MYQRTGQTYRAAQSLPALRIIHINGDQGIDDVTESIRASLQEEAAVEGEQKPAAEKGRTPARWWRRRREKCADGVVDAEADG